MPHTVSMAGVRAHRKRPASSGFPNRAGSYRTPHALTGHQPLAAPAPGRRCASRSEWCRGSKIRCAGPKHDFRRPESARLAGMISVSGRLTANSMSTTCPLEHKVRVVGLESELSVRATGSKIGKVPPVSLEAAWPPWEGTVASTLGWTAAPSRSKSPPRSTPAQVHHPEQLRPLLEALAVRHAPHGHKPSAGATISINSEYCRVRIMSSNLPVADPRCAVNPCIASR